MRNELGMKNEVLNGFDWSAGTLSGGTEDGSVAYGGGTFVVVWQEGQAT
jgi:hypothetical protein